MTLRVIIVDDHPMFRAGVRAVLDGTDDILVVAEAETTDEALAAVATYAPDLVLMDLHLPGASGIEATRAVVRDHPTTRVLVMTMSSDDETVIAAMRAGARGYLVKGSGRDEVLASVRAVGAGGAVFSPAVADRFAAYFSGLAAAPGREVFPGLTEREREVLDLVARGYDNRRIARELFLAEKTVRNHVSSLFMKLDVTDRSEVIVRARNAGLGA